MDTIETLFSRVMRKSEMIRLFYCKRNWFSPRAYLRMTRSHEANDFSEIAAYLYWMCQGPMNYIPLLQFKLTLMLIFWALTVSMELRPPVNVVEYGTLVE